MKFSGNLSALIRSYDWVLIAIVFVLSTVGFAAIYSVDLSRNQGSLTYFPIQLLAFFLGLAVLFIGGALHITIYQSFGRVFYFFALFLLVAVLFFGSTIRGTSGWFRVGGLSFQPAEFAKVALILALSVIINRIGRRFDRIQFVIVTGLTALLPVFLIIAQPDLGSALVLAGVWFGILLLTTPKKRYVFGIVGIALLCAAAGWFTLFKPYQKERILTFLEPGRDPLGTGYNVTQSLIAIGAGKFFGRGLGFGSQSQLRFLPEAQTDFIFSVIAEELGFVGAALVISLYALLLWRLAALAYRCHNDFGAYLVLGTACLFFVQITLNIGAATGFLPVTGVTLPFLSYGGSSLLVNFFLIGAAESVYRSADLRRRA